MRLVTLEKLETSVHLENKDLPATQEVLVMLVMQESLERKAQAVHLVAMEPTEHQELQEHKDPQDLQESLVLKERLEYLAKITMLAAQKENLEMTEHREIRAHKDQLVETVWVLKKVPMVLSVSQETLDLQEIRELKELQVNMVEQMK